MREGGRGRRRGQTGQIARAGAGQGGEERRTWGRHADGRAGQRGETRVDDKGRARADKAGNIMAGQGRRDRVVQCSKIELDYSRHHDTPNGLRK